MQVDSTRVRQLRLGKSWSQELLAGKAGVNLRTIQRIEAGGGASLATRRRVAAALGVDVSALGPPDAGRRPSILVGVYALMAVLSLGIVLLDQIYAGLMRDRIATADSAFVFSEAADLLLELAMVTLVIGAIAVVAVWERARARALVIASIGAGTLFPLAFIAAVNGLFPMLADALDASGAGALIRFASHAAAAGLAVWAWTASAVSPSQWASRKSKISSA